MPPRNAPPKFSKEERIVHCTVGGPTSPVLFFISICNFPFNIGPMNRRKKPLKLTK
jgi:hypothetical protein